MGMKTGLILEGGAMRGMFTAGVMDVMMEAGIKFNGGVGVSAGAAFGVNYKSGQIGRAIRYNMRFCADSRYCGFRSLLTSGNIYNTDFCYREVPLEHDKFDFEAYKRNPMEFYVVCTDIERGEPVYHKYEGTEEGFDWIRASASMPFVSQIVELEGKKMLDGAITDAIPLRFFQGLGYDRNVAILTRPRNYVKKPYSALGLVRRRYRKYPQLVAAMERQHTEYNQTLAEISRQERAGKLLVIRPESTLPVSRVEKDPQRLKACYDIGRQVARKRLEEIRIFLGQN